MLEPYDGKLSSTVLRGERGSNVPDLPDNTVMASAINLRALATKRMYRTVSDRRYRTCHQCKDIHIFTSKSFPCSGGFIIHRLRVLGFVILEFPTVSIWR
ncbi:hypothetical protein FMM78_15760 [Bacteroides caecimuris]|nr:hypothetical protein [Bacteroides caecimuris]